MAEIVVENAYAKINLNLYITGKREDGYHTLYSVMQTLDLHDEIEIKKINKGIVLNSNSEEIPLDNNNTVYRVAELLKYKYNLEGGWSIDIKKNIPVGAGLGGPSADAAAVIRGINRLENLSLSLSDMEKIGVKIGADVPFLINGGTCLCQGIGEKLQSLNGITIDNVLLVKPNVSVSTVWAYKKFDEECTNMTVPSSKLINGISNSNYYEICEGLYNDFEDIVLCEYPIIKNIKESLLRNGADSALMSGSGSCVFGLFHSREKMEKCQGILQREEDKLITFCTKAKN